jgi:hypothetical protein
MTPTEELAIEQLATRLGALQTRYMDGIDRYQKEGDEKKLAYCAHRLDLIDARIGGMKDVIEALGYRLYYVREDDAYQLFHWDSEKEECIR